MKVGFRDSFVLDNSDYSEIWQPERIAIGKAVFFSMKYNATLGEVSAALGSSFIDSIEVDGYPAVSEYQNIDLLYPSYASDYHCRICVGRTRVRTELRERAPE